jgi:hypothetical protein
MPVGYWMRSQIERKSSAYLLEGKEMGFSAWRDRAGLPGETNIVNIVIDLVLARA